MQSRLAGVAGLKRSEILVDTPERVSFRAYPDATGAGAEIAGGALAGALAALASRENWKIEQLHTAEGRLDEVFRSITWSETAAQAAHRNATLEARS